MTGQVLFATHNQGKLRELVQLVGAELSVRSLGDFPAMPEVVEDAETFEGNARKKAVAAAAASGLCALADDSGLCVDALGGGPGVRSARYAPGSDADRCRKVLDELSGVPESNRACAFVCALCLAFPDGRTVIELGRCEGRVALKPRGEQGFGYDPVFLTSSGKTMAELTREEKSAISHRGQAFAKMRPHLLQLRS